MDTYFVIELKNWGFEFWRDAAPDWAIDHRLRYINKTPSLAQLSKLFI